MERGLYVIVDLEALGPRDPIAFVDCVLSAGRLSALQLRAKRAPATEIVKLGSAMASRCKRARVPFVMNDRADLAVLAGADMVHVGQEDLDVPTVRRLAPGLGVGVSTHDEQQYLRALDEGADYVAVGPVFPTTTKSDPDPVVGLARFADRAARSRGVPIVAIGGVTTKNARSVAQAGATAGAAISALAAAIEPSDLAQRAAELHRALGGA